MIKSRQSISAGLLGKESSWDLGAFKIVDFSNIVVAGATTERAVAFFAPVSRPGPAGLKAVGDNYPTEQGQSLAAATNQRQTGTGSAPFCHLVEAFVVHVTGGGAVYNPAGTTVQIHVISSFTTSVGTPIALTGAFNVATATNGIDPITITAPADRQIGIEGVALATAAAIYNGDIVVVTFVTTGALTVNPNVLAVGLGFEG